MADYAFFMMGVAALVAAGVVGAICILLTIACVITARKRTKASSGLTGLILALGSLLTCGVTALPALAFALIGIRQKAYPRVSWTAAILSVCVMFICIAGATRVFFRPAGRSDQVVGVSEKVLAPYQGALVVDRRAMGFPPLPTNGMVKIETVDRANWRYEYPPPPYDVMLIFYANPDRCYPNTTHQVALKRGAEGLKWVHESMGFSGPKRYETGDGECNESISIVCETEQIAFIGTNLEGMAICYSGQDARLAGQRQPERRLTVAQVGPILREWGYTYDIDQAQQQGRGYSPPAARSAQPTP